jgi:transposase
MKTKYCIALTDSEREYAQKVLNSETKPMIYKRAQIILARDSAAGKPQTHVMIAERVGVTPQTVLTICKLFCKEGLESVLRCKKRAKSKKWLVTDEVEAHIVAVARGNPPEGYSRWTLESLTDRIALDIAPGISIGTVRRTLIKHNISLTGKQTAGYSRKTKMK